MLIQMFVFNAHSSHRQQKTAYLARFHAWANLFFQKTIFDFLIFPHSI